MTYATPDPEFTHVSGQCLRMTSQIRFKLPAKPRNPDRFVVLSDCNGERILTWCSATQPGTRVIEIVHEGELSRELVARHGVSVNGFIAIFEAQGGEIVPCHLLEPTPSEDE